MKKDYSNKITSMENENKQLGMSMLEIKKENNQIKDQYKSIINDYEIKIKILNDKLHDCKKD